MLAVHRLTRLVTEDTITAPIRDRLVEHAYRSEGRADMLRGSGFDTWTELATEDHHAPKLATLITCRWCTSIWIAGGVLAARRFAPRLWDPLARLLALSSLSTLTAGLERH